MDGGRFGVEDRLSWLTNDEDSVSGISEEIGDF